MKQMKSNPFLEIDVGGPQAATPLQRPRTPTSGGIPEISSDNLSALGGVMVPCRAEVPCLTPDGGTQHLADFGGWASELLVMAENAACSPDATAKAPKASSKLEVDLTEHTLQPSCMPAVAPAPAMERSGYRRSKAATQFDVTFDEKSVGQGLVALPSPEPARRAEGTLGLSPLLTSAALLASPVPFLPEEHPSATVDQGRAIAEGRAAAAEDAEADARAQLLEVEARLAASQATCKQLQQQNAEWLCALRGLQTELADITGDKQAAPVVPFAPAAIQAALREAATQLKRLRGENVQLTRRAEAAEKRAQDAEDMLGERTIECSSLRSELQAAISPTKSTSEKSARGDRSVETILVSDCGREADEPDRTYQQSFRLPADSAVLIKPDATAAATAAAASSGALPVTAAGVLPRFTTPPATIARQLSAAATIHTTHAAALSPAHVTSSATSSSAAYMPTAPPEAWRNLQKEQSRSVSPTSSSFTGRLVQSADCRGDAVTNGSSRQQRSISPASSTFTAQLRNAGQSSGSAARIIGSQASDRQAAQQGTLVRMTSQPTASLLAPPEVLVARSSPLRSSVPKVLGSRSVTPPPGARTLASAWQVPDSKETEPLPVARCVMQDIPTPARAVSSQQHPRHGSYQPARQGSSPCLGPARSSASPLRQRQNQGSFAALPGVACVLQPPEVPSLADVAMKQTALACGPAKYLPARVSSESSRRTSSETATGGAEEPSPQDKLEAALEELRIAKSASAASRSLPPATS